jgi:DNA-binding PadR family transcriptional regulator
METVPTVSQRFDWLVAFMAAGDPDRTLDPVRIQKGLFLLSEEGPGPLRNLYEFEPYHFGPCSFELYRDLDSLEAEGLLQSQVPPGQTWKTYELTAQGRQAGGAVLDHADPHSRQAIEGAMEFVMTRSFRRLLKDVYSKYPAYATKSVLR